MTAYKAPDFNERSALSRQAKQKALEKLRAKPVATEAELAERKAAREAREAAEIEARHAKRAEAERARAERLVAEREAKARADEAKAQAAQARVRTEAEKKAERDARYAARKARK